jgi:hypothetical protein
MKLAAVFPSIMRLPLAARNDFTAGGGAAGLGERELNMNPPANFSAAQDHATSPRPAAPKTGRQPSLPGLLDDKLLNGGLPITTVKALPRFTAFASWASAGTMPSSGICLTSLADSTLQEFSRPRTDRNRVG